MMSLTHVHDTDECIWWRDMCMRMMDAIVKPAAAPGLELRQVPVPVPGPGIRNKRKALFLPWMFEKKPVFYRLLTKYFENHGKGY